MLALLSGCASVHFFPQTKPLFLGLDETRVPVAARAALAQAKVDFQLARQGEPPRYAKYVKTISYSYSKVYQGNGYKVTEVNKNLVDVRMAGPEIVLEPSLTGDKPYHYDEIVSVGE